MEVINRGKIVIDLVAGSVEIPTPKFDEAIPQQKEMTRATEAQGKATKEVNDKLKEQEKIQKEIERANQLILADRVRRAKQEEDAHQQILADRVRRHQQELARIEEKKRAEQQAIQQRIAQERAINEAIQKTSEGFLKVTRAAILLGFSQDESLQSLLKNLAIVQAGFDAFDGSRKIVMGVKEAMAQAAAQGKSLFSVIGSGNIALAAAAAAASLVAVTLSRAREEEKKYQEQVEQGQRARDAVGRARFQELSPDERLKTAESERMGLPGLVGSPDQLEQNAQRYVRVEQDILAAKRAQLQIDDQKYQRQIESIRTAAQELEIAKQRVTQEQSLVRSTEASYSRLKTFEQNQLKAAADQLRRGESINEYQRGLFEKAGQGGIAEASRAREGRAEGSQEFIDSIKGMEGASTGVNGSFEELKKQAHELAKTFEQITQGKGAEDAIAVLEQQREEIERASADLGKAFVKALRHIEGQVEAETDRNRGVREATASAAAANANAGNAFF